jgi:hypothetical protein
MTAIYRAYGGHAMVASHPTRKGDAGAVSDPIGSFNSSKSCCNAFSREPVSISLENAR